MRLARVQFRDSVLVSGMTGEKLHLTIDEAILTLDGVLLRIVPRDHDTETLVPIENVRWLWALAHTPIGKPPSPAKTHDSTKTPAVPGQAVGGEAPAPAKGQPGRGKPR